MLIRRCIFDINIFPKLILTLAIRKQISTEQLINFFARCGPITYCRMAGDESHPSRFAFIEFATLTGAQAAMLLNGTTLLDRPIK